ncbi:histidine phosphatase family protein [Pseudofrankia asymbiotica]|uniref:Histidine phosphatase family protein n=1 Tax=Pseudofrankia asymbiotica TaxID=1834516 RepID=A0A1V2I983_9ACTN|nr:histidine phosphatase family protein [Pseudofrankia asymbiotica]ONH27563.1 histidine phosphatase family protein [Pseudofrankia asymbiotica]
MRLLLIRHGQTPYNVIGALDTGRPGAGLTPLGQAQAQAIPDALRDDPISAIYASVLVRTHLTAAPLAAARGLTVHIEEGLEEIVAGDLELRTDKESITTYLETVGAWIHGDLDVTMPGGENGHAFVARYDNAIANIAAAHTAGDTVVVISHGAAIRTWVAIRVGAVGSADEWLLPNTGMVVLDGGVNTGWNLTRWQDKPLGGVTPPDVAAHDVTGEPVGEAIAEISGTG